MSIHKYDGYTLKYITDRAIGDYINPNKTQYSHEYYILLNNLALYADTHNINDRINIINKIHSLLNPNHDEFLRQVSILNENDRREKEIAKNVKIQELEAQLAKLKNN